ncbi:hypothetical protein ElyMa_006280800 [Elysia marginata]|uniref:CUB domain-containing protein n=1 Tax=Elysia marginata TaxID=1093978 RepID=A0AAV4HFF5_9GAST|nr:hypothetical protein ElyMa_006280800 [Elysia marginata]
MALLVFFLSALFISEDVSSLCPFTDVTLEDDGETFVISHTNFSFLHEDGSFANCQLRIMPKFFDSTIKVEFWEKPLILDYYSDFSRERKFKFIVVGFDPTDPIESVLDYEDLKGIRYRSFIKMALRVHILVYYGASFNVTFTLQRASTCGSSSPLPARGGFNSIMSPDYPQPFPGNKSCKWTIAASRPIDLELMYYNGSAICDDHKLRIISLFEQTPSADVQSRFYVQEETFCGRIGNQTIFADKVFDQAYSKYTVHVLFYNERNPHNNTGFLLRYRQRGNPLNELEGPINNVESSSNAIGGRNNNGSEDLDRWCPPNVTLEHGQEVVISYENFTASKESGRLVKCIVTVRPKYNGSTILLKIKNARSYYRWPFWITTFDPSDPDEVPISEMRLTSPSTENSYPQRAIKIDMEFFYGRKFRNNFEFVLSLQKDSSPCGTTEIFPGTDSITHYYPGQFQFIFSPYYPVPYPWNITCEWTFSASSPMEFKLVDFDGREACTDESLNITFGTVKFFFLISSISVSSRID